MYKRIVPSLYLDITDILEYGKLLGGHPPNWRNRIYKPRKIILKSGHFLLLHLGFDKQTQPREKLTILLWAQLNIVLDELHVSLP